MTSLNDLNALISSYEEAKRAQDAAMDRVFETMTALDPDTVVRFPRDSLPERECPPSLARPTSVPRRPLLRA